MPERRLNLFSILATEKDTENCHHMEKIPKKHAANEVGGKVLQRGVRQAGFFVKIVSFFFNFVNLLHFWLFKQW